METVLTAPTATRRKTKVKEKYVSLDLIISVRIPYSTPLADGVIDKDWYELDEMPSSVGDAATEILNELYMFQDDDCLGGGISAAMEEVQERVAERLKIDIDKFQVGFDLRSR